MSLCDDPWGITKLMQAHTLVCCSNYLIDSGIIISLSIWVSRQVLFSAGKNPKVLSELCLWFTADLSQPRLGTTILHPQVIVGKTAAALHILNFNIKHLWDSFLLVDSVLQIHSEFRQSIQSNPNNFFPVPFNWNYLEPTLCFIKWLFCVAKHKVGHYFTLWK